MKKTYARTYLAGSFLRSVTLILVLLVTANAQQKPTAIWADVDLTKVEATKAAESTKSTESTKTAKSVRLSLDPEKKKSIWREPAWYVSLGGTALDIVGSIATIDGKRVSEGNPLFRRADGKVALTRALPVAALSLFAQYKSYKNPKHRKMAMAMMVASGVLHGVFGAKGFAIR
jgi:hypothetical protein